MRVPVSIGPVLTLGTVEPLFEFEAGTYFLLGRRTPRRLYEVAPDGQRFLMLKAADQIGSEDVSPSQINVVLNWHSELLERVPID